MREHLDDARRGKWGIGKPMPMHYAYVCLAERFGGWPWEIEDAPADLVAYYLDLLGTEGRYKSDLAGLQPHEEMFWEDDED